jgi:dTMP kinase
VKDTWSKKFIVIDGPDGCGKTTQARLLTQWLQGQKVPTELFRDPGGTAIGEKIRQILLDSENTAIGTRAEVLLYMAARAQLWAEEMAPALEKNKCVVLDRWLSSTCAYQGYAGGFGMEKVVRIATDCLERVWPDLTIILDVDLEASAKRLNRPLDRMEKKGDGYHQRVREGFLKLAESRDDFSTVDGSADIETVHKNVLEVLAQADLR